MTNAEIAQVFRGLADLLRAKKDNIFKIRAYEKVARSIEELKIPVARLVEEGRLKEVAGAGEIIQKKIAEIVTTGRLSAYERLKAEMKAEKNDRAG